MTRTQRIKRIVDLADMRKRIASQRIAGSRQRHDTNLGKLADFRGYLDEYTQVLITPGGSMSAADASGLRSFITQIERTISALEQHTERSGRECARDLEAWKKESHRASALLDVLARAQQAAAVESECRAQREIDDRKVVRGEE
jgi:flagellar export protein FliJ